VVLRALTGETATDETHANSTVFFDLNDRAWASDYLDAFSLTPRLFPDVVPPWTVVGGLSDSVAAATGALAGCPVVIGGADSQCAAFGSGVNSPGPISEMAGASSCLNSIVQAPLADTRVTHYSHVLPDCFCTELGINTTGAALTWAVDRLAFADYASLEAAARSVGDPLRRGAVADPIAAAPLFLPFLSDGERNDVTLRAAFIGLDDRHTRAELAYSVVEGVALSVASVLDVLTSAGAPMTDLRVAGGLARVGVLGALKADLLGVPVLHLDADTAPLGVALLAARNTGHQAEADAAIDSVVGRATTFEPSETGAEVLRARRDWFFAIRGSDAIRLAPER
jgi:sugar (pentulose or hexulose) kinase